MPQRLKETVQGHDTHRTPELGVRTFPRVQDSPDLVFAATCSGKPELIPLFPIQQRLASGSPPCRSWADAKSSML